MDTAAVLAAFDEQLRRHPQAGPAERIESDTQVTRVVGDGDGWSGVIWSDLTEASADAVIAAQFRRFAGLGHGWEWKHYSYDQPASLPARLLAAGQAVLRGLGVRPAPVAGVIAVAGDTPIAAGRVEFPAGGDFASLWGGGTLPAWRGRGIFRSLVAYRAALAHHRGYRYLHVDASPGSRPILQRLGFAELAETTPYRYPVARL